jgi:hypothetical protein
MNAGFVSSAGAGIAGLAWAKAAGFPAESKTDWQLPTGEIFGRAANNPASKAAWDFIRNGAF